MDGQNLHGNSPEKNDEKKNGFGAISVFLSDSVRHFKNIQNTHNTGHISTNFSNDNFNNDDEKSNKNNNDNNDNNDNKNFNINNAEIFLNTNKTKEFDNNNNNNDNNDNDDNKNFRKNGKGALNHPGVRGFPKGIKDWILAANKDIDEIWILNEIKNNSDSKYKNDNIYSSCFSTSISTSTSTSTSTSSPPCVANFKVKVLLRTRADGPTKVS